MASSLSVDGLVSGLDTTSLITSLVQAEAVQQTALKTRLTATQSAANAYRSVNAKVDALRAAAEDLAKATTWSAAKASSSSGAVAVAVTGSPQTGPVSFTVDSVAAAHAVVSDTRWATTATPAGFSSLEILDANGASKGSITVGGSGTVADAAAAINASTGTTGLSAQLLQTSSGVALQVSTRASGAAGEFSLSGSAFSVLRQASDAQVTVGDVVPPLTLRSATNTFADAIPGLTLTVSGADPATTVTVDVAADPDAVAAKVQAFVDAANGALAEISKQARNTPGSTAALKGDSALRRLTDQVLDAVSDAVGGGGSPAASGIELTRDGTVTFTKATFLTQLQADPAALQRVFAGTATANGADGVAVRMQALAKQTTDATTGTLTVLAQGRDRVAADLEDRIGDWDTRLAARKDALTRQFTAMETALSSLKSQSSWLAGQLSSLPSA